MTNLAIYQFFLYPTFDKSKGCKLKYLINRKGENVIAKQKNNESKTDAGNFINYNYQWV